MKQLELNQMENISGDGCGASTAFALTGVYLLQQRQVDHLLGG